MYMMVPMVAPGLLRTRSSVCVGMADAPGSVRVSSGAMILARAEIENFCRAVARAENVGGLDVAMDDAARVRGVERIGDFGGDLQQLLEMDRPARDAMLQRLAFEEFHHEEGVALIFADIVDGADVGIVQRGGGAGFAAEAFQSLRIAGSLIREKFDGHGAAEADVFGFVDDAHAATADFFDDAVVGNRASDHRRFAHERRILLRFLFISSTGGRCGFRSQSVHLIGLQLPISPSATASVFGTFLQQNRVRIDMMQKNSQRLSIR